MSDIAINPVTRRVQFTGNTGTGPYAFNFNVLQSSDIVVYKNNVLLTETTDYTVSIAANGTGNITMVVALVLTDILTIIGGRELSRTTDFVTAGDLLASSLNEQLDSNVIMSQQLDERFGRTLAVPPGDEDAVLNLPLLADRAGKLISFATNGSVTSPATTAAQLDAAVSSFINATGNNASSILYDPSGTGAVQTTVQSKLRQTVSVKDFGAGGDGVSDDTAAIQAAIDAVSVAGGGKLFFPRGNYLMGDNILLKSNVELIGETGSQISRNADYRIKGIPSPTYTSLTAGADLDKGSTIITLDASSYTSVGVGSYLYVRDKAPADASDFINDFVAASTADLQDPDKWVYMEQHFKIIELLGSNQVRINSASIIDFALTGAGDIYLTSDAIENVSIRDIEFVNNSGLSGSSAEAAFINTAHVYGLNIENCRFTLNGYTGGIYKNFGAARIVNCDFDMPKQLAVFLRQACPNSVISGNTFRNQTSGDASVFIEAHNYNVVIDGNTFDGARNDELSDAAQLICAVQMDAKVTNTTITNNTVNGYGVGVRMELGCMMNVVSNNVFSNISISGVRVVQSAQLTINDNKFFDCGIASTIGTLSGSAGAIFYSAITRSIISNNMVVCDSSTPKPGFLGTPTNTLIQGNRMVNVDVGISHTGGGFCEVKDNDIRSETTSQIINISGTSNHHNRIERNTMIATSGSNASYGIRIDDGSECNIIRLNRSEDCDYVIGLTSTSDAQWIHENWRQSDSNTATVSIINNEILAPVMPTNATMPRRFRIYRVSNSAGAGALDPIGDEWWEYLMEISGTNYFRKFDITTTQVGI